MLNQRCSGFEIWWKRHDLLITFWAQKSDSGLVQSAMTSVDRGHCRCVFEFVCYCVPWFEVVQSGAGALTASQKEPQQRCKAT